MRVGPSTSGFGFVLCKAKCTGSTVRPEGFRDLCLDTVVRMSTYQTDPRVDEYIESLPGWQQDICRQVRDLVHAADPDVIETIKRTRQPYFTLNGKSLGKLGQSGVSETWQFGPTGPPKQSQHP